jgi:PAS domain S-box-containing protein
MEQVMNSNSLIGKYESISRVCGVLVVAISGAALVGWFTGSVVLKGIHSSYIPMAPNTSAIFILLGVLFVGFRNTPGRFLLVTRIAAVVSIAIVTARLSEYLTGLGLIVDDWPFAFPSERLGLAPVGNMAFFTAVTFLFLSLGLLLVTSPNRRWANDLAKALSVVVMFIGLMFSLGYVYGAPLLYSGTSIPMALNTAICFLIFGAGLLMRSSVRDVAERRLAKEALQRAHDELEVHVQERTGELLAQQEFLRAVVETSPHAIFVKDSEGRYTFVNKAVANAYGRPVEEIIGMTEADFSGDGDEVRTFLEDDRHVLATLTSKFIPDEQLTNPKTGETRSFQTIKVPLRLPGSNAVQILGVATDITDRKRAEQALDESEQQLRQSQKLEAVGRLAGGVAHDFNNLLTVIMGYSDMLLRSELEDEVREKLAEINKAADRAASLTRQLLAFSRKQVLKPEVINPNALIEGTGKMLRRLIGEDIEVLTALREDVGKVNADPGQIEQVLINLVVNARDAMPRGGTITIETGNVTLDEAYADLHFAVSSGSYVMLAVSDTGMGMDAETRKHIFEPFFTTKELGKGTGLGLSMVYGIVKQSGGNIWVYSEPGKGTTFKIYLPLVHSEVAERSLAGEARAASQPATETILLIEDEEMVRNLAVNILQERGYRVLAALNGEEAIEFAESHAGAIDMMITDVVMPRMNGKQIAERVSNFRPGIPVLYMSGYTDEAIVHHGVIEAGTNFIEKPFTSGGLASKIREILDKPNADFLEQPQHSDQKQLAIGNRLN